MSPETMMGIAILAVLLTGVFIGYLFGKGRINVKTELLEKNVATAMMLLDECKNRTEEEIRKLIEKIKQHLEEK